MVVTTREGGYWHVVGGDQEHGSLPSMAQGVLTTRKHPTPNVTGANVDKPWFINTRYNLGLRNVDSKRVMKGDLTLGAEHTMQYTDDAF